MIRSGRQPVEVGRQAGRALKVEPDPGEDGVDQMASAMLRQGFEPTVVRQGAQAEIVLGVCPFASTALTDPATVCDLHLGLAEGLAEDTDAVVDGLDREDPRRAGCRLHLHLAADAPAPHDA